MTSQASVNAMAGFSTPVESPASTMNDERPVKSKGKWLQRISSSPTLAQFSRRRAKTSPYSSRSTLSCISFAPLISESPATQSTTEGRSSGAPASGPASGLASGLASEVDSTPATPGPDTPYYDPVYRHIALRRIENEAMAGVSTLPQELKQMSIADVKRPASSSSAILEIVEDYFTEPLTAKPKLCKNSNFKFWEEMPHEIKLHIFAFLKPKELVRASNTCRDFHKTCFDGQLWTCFDASEFYAEIPAESLAKIIVSAGPFIKDLNLRGCVQVEHYKRAEVVVKACKNLINATLEGCRNFQKATLHNLLKSNGRLANLNLTGLSAVTNATCKIIAQSCPHLEMFNVSWCTHMDALGLQLVIQGCPKLKDLRAGEVRGLENEDLALLIFETNQLERLVLSGCTDITDNILKTMIHDLEDLIELTNNLLSNHLAKAPCASTLQHLSLSYCENLGDAGMLPVIRACTSLQNIDMDNTRISDLILAEAATMVRLRSSRTTNSRSRPSTGLRMVVFDCSNVTWTGIREVLSRNSEITKPDNDVNRYTFPTEIITLKCFYGWQLTVDEHTKRVLRGDLSAAARLERKWTEYMMANEEAGADGAGIRRRRRRAREAQLMHADEEEGGVAAGGVGRRRRARSSACAIM
ncbi:hypothetical protein SS1G_06964 [Sclerotinia sclerotiorum 1980 UF-70]|uniref:F-box domain-containing protein n=1 Tax=Sclerotinia sclerotiorum (strain ATCC 18683 / 1980 / Ss-1) TaxID=665079 RepID=A7ENR5_SCLS1|nr:hypothetical protein SS1G_06964 [Sclerotinia sclerotiorum 1980 UF-70]EDO04481.1 hypothetical protein SS1G_06964 [Sclerotinia sclerotiorum 1980 UF-70]